MNPRLPWHARLDLRLALVVVVVLTLLCAVLLSWQGRQAQRRFDAYEQWQNFKLARYIADRQPQAMVDGQGRIRPGALADTAMYITMIHPALEAYLLDAQGRIVQHSLPAPGPALRRVDLDRVHSLIMASPPKALPVYGDDPRRPGQLNLVSVAALPSEGNPQGYLYVVLRGAAAGSLQAEAAGQASLGPAWGLTLGALALAGLCIVGVQMSITRRLRRLVNQMQAFRQADGAQFLPAEAGQDEIALVASAAERLQQRVQEQFRRLEDSERLRRELVSNITHDLHTPLANVQGYIETLLLRGEGLSAQTREQYLRIVLQHCVRLGRRVAELFELARLESGQAQAQFEPFCMADLLNDVVQSHQLVASQAGVNLCIAADIEAPAREALVLADIRLIERVLQNLVDNALRHTAAGGRVELAVQLAGARLIVRVRDNGQGIAGEDLPHIFERYWSTREGRDARPLPAQSAGLGLAIVQRILALHGSHAEVQSSLGQGSEFSFALPCPR
ncbi:signal transduction histidine kinase [Paucibacter oligotrophus]|uniref:histidine kinase n=1 Tax=Roseateles oligotrophus TaxID=1769250 RepID=A0A840L8X9_9BURK|nr:HAMP domain-containing sensor histidine kinase [Roseateles oligotrophus]MBB4842589.1 signal transduction histidine kinase [Roseateles oligotrophus]